MIDALIGGRVYGKPAQRTAKTGNPFVTAKMRVATGDGESIFCNVIAFDATPCTALLALADGDSVALAGTLTPKVWIDKAGTPKPAIDLVAQQVMTPYQVTRKRRTVADSGDGGQHE